MRVGALKVNSSIVTRLLLNDFCERPGLSCQVKTKFSADVQPESRCDSVPAQWQLSAGLYGSR